MLGLESGNKLFFKQIPARRPFSVSAKVHKPFLRVTLQGGGGGYDPTKATASSGFNALILSSIENNHSENMSCSPLKLGGSLQRTFRFCSSPACPASVNVVPATLFGVYARNISRNANDTASPRAKARKSCRNKTILCYQCNRSQVIVFQKAEKKIRTSNNLYKITSVSYMCTWTKTCVQL